MFDKQNEKIIFRTINRSLFPLLISHKNPDGDTLGACLALSLLLTKNNKNHKLFCIDKPADYFNFLPGLEKIISNQDQINLDNHDLIVAIDCGSFERLGIQDKFAEAEKKLTLINIDHHQSNDYYGHHNLVLTKASSTSEIMFHFFTTNQLEVDKYMATCLLTGILSDTMNFTNAATTEESLKIASELLKLGARTNQIINNLTQNKNLFALKLC